MLLTAFGWKRNTIKQGLFFLGLSFAFSGMVLVAVQLAEPDFLLLGGRAYYAVSTPTLLLLAGLSYTFAAVVLAGCGTHKELLSSCDVYREICLSQLSKEEVETA